MSHSYKKVLSVQFIPKMCSVHFIENSEYCTVLNRVHHQMLCNHPNTFLVNVLVGHGAQVQVLLVLLIEE